MSVPHAKPIPEMVAGHPGGARFQFYDFFIYGFMAAALARAFFPGGDSLAGLLKTFATFAVGFLVRPLGAMIAGSYGDRHGRRQALVLTIVMMAVSTGVTGLLPHLVKIFELLDSMSLITRRSKEADPRLTSGCNVAKIALTSLSIEAPPEALARRYDPQGRVIL